MKKVLFLALISLLFLGSDAYSQIRWGVKAGVTASDHFTEYQGGVALQAGIPLIGLKVQPEILYSYSNHFGYVQVPVHIQWGLDLILLRPYLAVSPYANFLVHQSKEWMNRENIDYGVGLGAGLDIWKLQLQVQYRLSADQYSRGVQYTLAYFF